MATTNVVATKVGTGWTIDVTSANLLPDLNIKDFTVLIGGAQVSVIDFTKTTATVLTYTGISIASSTVEVRRKTPNAVVQTVTYKSQFSSALWNAELDRSLRWKEEADLNGVGPGSLVSIQTPDNGSYPTGWASDTVRPPTRQAAFNIISTLLPAATAATVYAPKISPVLEGNPRTAAPPSGGDYSTSIPTTKWVNDWYYFQKGIGMAYTNNISIAHNTHVSLGAVFLPEKLAGNITLLNGGPDFLRVPTNGWYRFIVHAVEVGVFTDYSFLDLSVDIFDGSTFSVLRTVQRLNFTSGTTRLTNPILTGTCTAPVTFSGSVDKILTIGFQQANNAVAARNFYFYFMVEKLYS